MKLSVQKVHEDPRGTIFSILLPPNRELMLFFCKAGYLRGGHSHSVPEIVIVLSGKLQYHKVVDGKEKVFELSDGDVVYNLPTEPHMAGFLLDSWVAEWKINSGIGEWTTTDYEPFRSQVRRRLG